MEDKSKIQGIVRNPCSQCGSEAIYSAKAQKLVCGHCGHEEPLILKNDKIIEKSYSENIVSDGHDTGMGKEHKNFHCKSCGSVTMVDASRVVIDCPFCGSSQVNEEAYSKTIIKPEGIIPFVVDKNTAYQTFKEWIGNGWFRPNRLKNVTTLEKIHGVYVPFWTYDAMTESTWWAEAGYYYYETEYYTDENGNTQSRQVQKIRWIPVSGNYDEFFDDVTVIGSKGISQARVQQIYPYDFTKLINYDPRILVGWESELYGIDVHKGFEIAERIMDDYIRNACAKQIPGDTYRFLEVNTHKYNITYKHLLLPVWIAAYKYNNKVFQVIVNGQTGKISGEKPLSWTKIILFILFILALIFLIVQLKK